MSYQLSPAATRSLDESLAQFGCHAVGWRTHAAALTKQEVFGKLALEGVRRGLIPIGEYALRYIDALGDGATKDKALDLVWARRIPARSFSRAAANQTIWDIVAAFEIEGYDNGGRKTPGDHLLKDVAALAGARLRWGAQATAVVLFSVAYDRECKGEPQPSYQDTRNAATWHAGVRLHIDTRDADLRRHPAFTAHTSTPVLIDADLDAWLAKLNLR